MHEPCVYTNHVEMYSAIQKQFIGPALCFACRGASATGQNGQYCALSLTEKQFSPGWYRGAAHCSAYKGAPCVVTF